MPIVPNTYDNVTWVFTCAGSPKEVTWSHGFRWIEDPPSPADTAENIYAWSTDSTSAPFRASLMLNEWAFQGVSVSRGTLTGPLVGQYFEEQQGVVTGGSVPMNCSYLMRKNTNNGGRKFRGRAFIPPVHVAETAIDGAGNIDAAFVTSVQTYMDVLFDAPQGSTQGGNWYLLHSTDPPIPTEVTSWNVQNKIATQRRRLR